MYAVISLQWHQYIVKQWDKIVVDNMDMEDWNKFDVDQVLAIFDEKAEKVVVGNPNVKAKVSMEVSNSQKWEKLRVIKFRRKNRYQRTIWFRQHQTVLEIKKIEFNG